MKNAFKLLSIIAMVAVIGFSMLACDLGDPGDDKVAKFLVITDIPDKVDNDTVTLKDKQITVAICSNSKKDGIEIVALNQANSKDTVKIPLLSGNESKQGEPFTGTGEFYIFLFFDVKDTTKDIKDDTTYAYGGGGNLATKYNIQNETTTLSFSDFKKQD
jgi:hypothetical protein